MTDKPGAAAAPSYWVEFECPHQGADFDTDDLPHPDTPVYCSYCGGKHTGRDHGQAFRLTGDEIEVLSMAEWEALTAAQPPREAGDA